MLVVKKESFSFNHLGINWGEQANAMIAFKRTNEIETSIYFYIPIMIH